MAYNINNVSTAGKVSVFACVLGLLSFAFIFTINISKGTFNTVEAQSVASTTVTVLNTPPQWTVDAEELIESSTTTPTNAGDVVSWVAVGTDSNADPYWLLICKTSANPTARSNNSPICDATSNQWSVSPTTTSATQATAATTTLDSFVEVNAWFAWICDADLTTPRCNATFKQGTSTTASPFEVNHRPTFTAYTNTGSTLPGQVVTFYSTSTDTDVSGTADTVRLFVCNLNDFNTTTNLCGPGGTIASSTFVATHPSAAYTVVIPTQDQTYSAFGFIIDNHGFEASGGSQGTNSSLTVQNATPSVASSTISINNGTNMILTVESGSTTGFTMQYVVSDNNSCVNAASTSEIVSYQLSLYRSGVGSTTCATGNSSLYNPNNCYTSAVATSSWNLLCTATTTGNTCTGSTDTTIGFDCSFPLWYVADPTDGTATSTQFSTEDWRAQVRAVDDNGATSTATETANPREVLSFLAFDLNTAIIPYGSIEPGAVPPPLAATTTISATGNVGLDQRLTGEAMCINFATGNECPNSATSTVPAEEQVYATSSVAYASGVALSSTTNAELELDVRKSTSTVTQSTGITFWGIRIPASITLAGNYKGENTFTAIVGESSRWAY